MKSVNYQSKKIYWLVKLLKEFLKNYNLENKNISISVSKKEIEIRKPLPLLAKREIKTFLKRKLPAYKVKFLKENE